MAGEPAGVGGRRVEICLSRVVRLVLRAMPVCVRPQNDMGVFHLSRETRC